MKSNDRTIAAISTPNGTGGISVIRVSGDDAVGICNKIFKGKESLTEAKSHTVHYGYIIDESGKHADEVLVTVMLAPKTYTKEDVVEISTHGGQIASKTVMELLIKNGAYPAEPGEFTKRAFLNGRIDLSQAEGVIDIINSKTLLEQRNALSQAEGSLFSEISSLRKGLVHLAAQMQVAIDYPDEDLEDVTEEDIKDALQKTDAKVRALIESSNSGKVIKEGIKTAIIGKPNVGKSSLLNRLAREDRAIVTDVAGTTRDIIEEFVTLNGVPLRLFDTAGIRDAADEVEKIGVDRAKKVINEADLILLVLDSSRELDETDSELLEMTKDKKRILISNKNDIKTTEIKNSVEISAKSGAGIERLAELIKEMYKFSQIETGGDVVITNMRHLAALTRADEALTRGQEQLMLGMPQDIAALDINDAIDILGEITGETVSEDIVTEIFHNFCVGK